MDIGGLLQIVSSPIRQWGETEVDMWLLYVGLEHLSFHFKKFGIIGHRLLAIDLHFCLKELKMKSRIIIKKILRWIQFLNINQKIIEKAVIEYKQVNKEYYYFCSEKDQDSTRIDDNDYFNQNTTLMLKDEKDEETQLIDLEKTKLNLNFSNRQNIFNTQSCSSFLIYQLFGEQIRFYSCHGKDMSIGTSNKNDDTSECKETSLKSCQVKHFRGQHIIYAETEGIQDQLLWCRVNFQLKLDRGYILEIGEVTFYVYTDQNHLNLRIVRGHGTEEQIFYFDGRLNETVRIGRKPNCQLSFPLDFTMTSYHGRFVFEGNLWHYYDQATTNGSWYMIRSREIITDGMTLRIGDSEFIYQFRFTTLLSDEAEAIQQQDLCLSCNIKIQNCIMRPCYHRTLCKKCAEKMMECPQCGCFSTGLIEVYPQ